MGASKEMFLELRAEEFAVMYDHSFTKKDAVLTGKRMVDEILEAGEIEPLQIWANICRLKEVVNSADAEFRNRIELFDKTNIHGVEFSHVNGGDTLNYKDDPIYLDIFNELKEREELLKLAYKSKNEIYDSEGIEVAKVSSSPRKSSITIKF
jgi:hypothetical protein